jgi:hypothetical protein
MPDELTECYSRLSIMVKAFLQGGKLMNRIRMTFSALAIVAVTAAGGAIPGWFGDDHAVVADRWCC